MEMELKEKGDITIIELSGKVNAQNSPELKRKIEALLGEGRNKLVFALEKVNYIDSEVLGVLLSGLKATRDEKGDLKLASIQEEVQKVLGLTQANRIFDIFENQDDAVKAFQ